MEQAGVLACDGAITVGGGTGIAVCSGGAGEMFPSVTPQLSQKVSPGIVDVPQTWQVITTAVGVDCGIFAATFNVGDCIASPNLVPHSSQKAAPSGCCAPQFVHIDINFLLVAASSVATSYTRDWEIAATFSCLMMIYSCSKSLQTSSRWDQVLFLTPEQLHSSNWSAAFGICPIDK